jgi:hypothetical protein
LTEYAAKNRDRVEQTRSLRQGWVEDVTRLVAQLRQWLQEADKEGVLRIEERQEEVSEEALGRYVLPGLRVLVGARQFFIRPMRRMTTARVEMAEDKLEKTEGGIDLTDGGLDHYPIYRLADVSGQRWVIVPREGFPPVPLTRETFEKAVLRLLR